jgi:hypothetical protein
MRFLGIAVLLAAMTPTALEAAPSCFSYRDSTGETACRAEPIVAQVRGRYYVWGGHEARVCADCSYDVVGVASGGIYDLQGNLLESLPRENGPGRRWRAQTLWTGAALYVWGGMQKYTELWSPGQLTQRGWIPGFHVQWDLVPATFNAYYVPGARLWVRMSQENAPPMESTLKNGAGGLRACWSEGETRLCQKFSMSDNSWGERLPE